MLKIWSLYVKGLQSYRSTKFENGLTPDEVEPGLNALAHTSAGMAEATDFFFENSNFDS